MIHNIAGKYPSPKNFPAISHFLKEVILIRTSKSRRLGLRQLALQLKMRSPSSLVGYIQGRVIPTKAVIQSMANYFGWDESELSHVYAICLLQQLRRQLEPELIPQTLDAMSRAFLENYRAE